MEQLEAKSIFWVTVKYFIAAFLSIALLELCGVDATKANVFSFEKFSFAILTLLSACLYTFDNVLQSIAKWFNKKSGAALSN